MFYIQIRNKDMAGTGGDIHEEASVKMYIQL